MITSAVLTMLFLNGACLEVKVGPTVSERDASIDSNEARTLSDGLADDLIRNRTDAIRGKLEKVFQSSVKEKGLERITSQMTETYGQPLECEWHAGSQLRLRSSGTLAGGAHGRRSAGARRLGKLGHAGWTLFTSLRL